MTARTPGEWAREFGRQDGFRAVDDLLEAEGYEALLVAERRRNGWALDARASWQANCEEEFVARYGEAYVDGYMEAVKRFAEESLVWARQAGTL